MSTGRRISLLLIATLFVLGGINHFVDAEFYLRMMPAYLPAHAALVAISGVAEILGGVGVLAPRTRRGAGIGLVALLIAVFPANVNMALNHLKLGDTDVPVWALWGRLPLQAVLIAWAWWFTRADRPDGDTVK